MAPGTDDSGDSGAVEVPTGAAAFAADGEVAVDVDIDSFMAGLNDAEDAPATDDAAPPDANTDDTPPVEGDYTPPTKEEWEEVQAKLGLIDVSLEQMLTAQEEPDPEAAETPDEEAAMALMQPKEFKPAQDLIDKVLVDGDPEALLQMFTDFAAVERHNNRIDMNRAILNGLNYAQPVHSATTKFYEKYPELLGARDLVERNLWDMRNKYPQANEMQLLRFTEQKLAPVIKKAREIAGQAGIKGGNKNLSPKPTAGAQPPAARPRQTPSAPKSGGTDIDSRLAELAEYASA